MSELRWRSRPAAGSAPPCSASCCCAAGGCTSMPISARRMACIVLATVLMGVAIVGMQALADDVCRTAARSSIRSLTIMAILVVCGVAVYAGVLRLFGVSGHRRDLQQGPRRAIAPRRRPCAGAPRRGMGQPHIKGPPPWHSSNCVFSGDAADRQSASRQLSRRDREVRRAAEQLRLHLLRRRPARDHGLAGPEGTAARDPRGHRVLHRLRHRSEEAASSSTRARSPSTPSSPGSSIASRGSAGSTA